MQMEGRLSPDANVKSLAGFAAAAIQGGLLLANTEGTSEPLERALRETLTHLMSYDVPAPEPGTEVKG